MSNPADHSFYSGPGQYDPPRTERGKPSAGAQIEGVAAVNSGARESAPKWDEGEHEGCGKDSERSLNEWTVVHDYVALLNAIDHTLSVHGHIDANTPLHERIQRTLAISSKGGAL